jgi:hypothetical protein
VRVKSEERITSQRSKRTKRNRDVKMQRIGNDDDVGSQENDGDGVLTAAIRRETGPTMIIAGVRACVDSWGRMKG